MVGRAADAQQPVQPVEAAELQAPSAADQGVAQELELRGALEVPVCGSIVLVLDVWVILECVRALTHPEKAD